MRFLPIFVSGCAAGAAICAALVRLREPAPAAPAATIVPAGPSPRETALGAQVDRLEKQVDRLQKDLIAARAEAASPPVATPPGKAAPGPRGRRHRAEEAGRRGARLPQGPAVRTAVQRRGDGQRPAGRRRLGRDHLGAHAGAGGEIRRHPRPVLLLGAGTDPDQEKLLGEQFLEDQPNDLNDLSRIIGNQVKKAMDPGAAEKERQDKLAAILSADQVRPARTLRAGGRRRPGGRRAGGSRPGAPRGAGPFHGTARADLQPGAGKGPQNPVEHLLSGDGGPWPGRPTTICSPPASARPTRPCRTTDSPDRRGFSMRTKTIVVPGP
ncbi:MAG: hypothetical protein U1F87_11790 [Kiritimatiellia bacterium]